MTDISKRTARQREKKKNIANRLNADIQPITKRLGKLS
jgi:hypothetical protein